MKTDNQQGWHLENSYTDLPQLLYSKVHLNPVSAPNITIFNDKLADTLGLHAKSLRNKVGAAIFAGNTLPEGSMPIAQAYAGHQFGHFTMLGDGRAILLGEQRTPKGKRLDMQLKGAGKTPYSRGGDGRATLGPMLREYIISEAMHALRIPTTRSLAVVETGESVMREKELPGAVLTRVAASHIRVGTFQYVSKWGTKQELQSLADYTIKRHFPHIQEDKQPYGLLLEEVIKRQASLIAKWQLVGFIHGVMNTDNMAISGEGIDYGPCAFMDIYDPETVFSSIDRQGRYAYGNQPKLAGWNLTRFAETLLPLLHENKEKAVEYAQEKITNYLAIYQDHWNKGMRAKLGIFNEEEGDEQLFNDLLHLLKVHKADYTNTFRALTFDVLKDTDLFKAPAFQEWHMLWQKRLDRQQETKEASQQLMRDHNPALIPRNHRVEEALGAAVKHGDLSVMHKLLRVLLDPYAHSSEQEPYTMPNPSTAPYQTFCGT